MALPPELVSQLEQWWSDTACARGAACLGCGGSGPTREIVEVSNGIIGFACVNCGSTYVFALDYLVPKLPPAK